ncbi:MAG: TonB-dependent receptor [Bacteroidetes bacterium]|nr:TonB-dependent receptor [Bacteroidota bacterium]
MKKIIPILILLVFLIDFHGFAGNPTVKSITVSGKITDKSTGEVLLGANVFVKELKSGTVTNPYGFYSISLPPGKYNFSYSYIGYEAYEKAIDLQSNITINIELAPKQQVLKEVVVTGKKTSENVDKNEMSVVKMDIRTIRQIPALMGEVDIIKAIQLLPGVQTTSEGSTGFSVRGGSPDQNLIQLDEATVYNASHLMGFFSVFNNDAIKDVKLYKGDIPPSYGGRLSSLLDVRMKEGNTKKFTATGGIGTISSRLTLEGPIDKDRVSYIISGRRTYADLFLRLSSNKDLRDNTLYFYDLNGKINFTVDENNRLFVSAYTGRDVFKNTDFKMSWGNKTATIRWNHLFSKRLFSNFTLIRSKFDYGLGIPAGRADSFKWTSILDDYSARVDFSFYPDPKNTVKFGLSTTYHQFSPGSAKGLGESSFFNEYNLPQSNALEHAVYAGNEQTLTHKLSVKYGLRLCMFQNIGRGVIYHFDKNYESIDSTVYSRGKVFHTYLDWEPRLAFTYLLDSTSSVKASYSRTVQYIHLASNSASGNPLDVWFPSSPNVQPQVGNQFSLGYFRNFLQNTLETSVEVYYKKNLHAIDFKDHAELLLNPKLEGELRFGTAESYGFELFVKIQKERFNGWVSYTLSSSTRKIPEINNGKAYRSPYDKPHNISIVMNYVISKRTSFGANWVFASGAPVTFPTGRAIIGNKVVPVYSDRNAYRMPTYHRLDLSITLKGKEKPGRKWQGEWNFSVYNAYARKNAWVINFVPDANDANTYYAEKTYLFSFIPAITYNFHF